jgi:hypothetical protein
MLLQTLLFLTKLIQSAFGQAFHASLQFLDGDVSLPGNSLLESKHTGYPAIQDRGRIWKKDEGAFRNRVQRSAQAEAVDAYLAKD